MKYLFTVLLIAYLMIEPTMVVVALLKGNLGAFMWALGGTVWGLIAAFSILGCLNTDNEGEFYE